MPEDDYAIQRVLSTYAIATGRGDWAPVLDLFVPDAVWAIPHLGLRLEGLAAIEGALAQLGGQFEYVLQLNAPALIEVSGDTATARAGMREVGRNKASGRAFEYLGIYQDSLVRTPAGWKFSLREFEVIGTQFWTLDAEA